MYIERLKHGCAAGVDGISSEHLKYAIVLAREVQHELARRALRSLR